MLKNKAYTKTFGCRKIFKKIFEYHEANYLRICKTCDYHDIGNNGEIICTQLNDEVKWNGSCNAHEGGQKRLL